MSGRPVGSPRRSPPTGWWSPCCAILVSAISACSSESVSFRMARRAMMSVEVYIPTPFRRATNNKDKVSVDAQAVRRLLDELADRFGALQGRARTEARGRHGQTNAY